MSPPRGKVRMVARDRLVWLREALGVMFVIIERWINHCISRVLDSVRLDSVKTLSLAGTWLNRNTFFSFSFLFPLLIYIPLSTNIFCNVYLTNSYPIELYTLSNPPFSGIHYPPNSRARLPWWEKLLQRPFTSSVFKSRAIPYYSTAFLLLMCRSMKMCF